MGLVGQAGVGWSDRRLKKLSAELTRICFEPTSATERLEAAFVVLALHLEPAHLRPALAILTDALLPVQLQVRSDRADADRGLVLVRKPGGSGWLLSRAELNAECGERLWTVLQAELGTDPGQPCRHCRCCCRRGCCHRWPARRSSRGALRRRRAPHAGPARSRRAEHRVGPAA